MAYSWRVRDVGRERLAITSKTASPSARRLENMHRPWIWLVAAVIGCGDDALKPDASPQVDAPRPDAAPDAFVPVGDCPFDPAAASGALRTAFGDQGRLSINPSPYVDSIEFAMLLDGDDIYIGGGDRSGGIDDSQLHLEKRNRCTGALVPSFGAGGVVTENVGTADDAVGPAALVAGSLYLVGAESVMVPDFAWRIEKRSAATGALDPSFGVGGAVTHNPSGMVDVALFAVVDTQHIYVVGFDSAAGPSDQAWRIEKRRLSDGGLDEGFGTGGLIVNNPSAGRDMVSAVAIHDGFLYIVGNDAVPGDDQWRIEKRSVIDGGLVTGFGTDGVVTVNPSPGPERVQAIAIAPPHMYITGLEGVAFGDFALRIEKRLLSDGSLVPSFGSAGTVTTNPSPSVDRFRDIALDDNALYVTGFDYSAGGVDAQWRIEKRSLSDGALVSGFGTGGVVTENFGDGDEWAFQILVDSSSVYVFGDYPVAAPDDYGWHLQRRAK
ncbi:MAG TPA: hypothetical protein VIV11_07775 [Kofleriaceae bacterium]